MEYVTIYRVGIIAAPAVKTIQHVIEHMGEDVINVSFDSPVVYDLRPGDYILYAGEKYKLNTYPVVSKKSVGLYTYNCVFESPIYDLSKVTLRDVDESGVHTQHEFHLTHRMRGFFDLIEVNLKRVYGDGVWKITTSDETNSRPDVNFVQNQPGVGLGDGLTMIDGVLIIGQSNIRVLVLASTAPEQVGKIYKAAGTFPAWNWTVEQDGTGNDIPSAGDYVNVLGGVQFEGALMIFDGAAWLRINDLSEYVPEMKFETISFSENSCLSALRSVCELYRMEYRLEPGHTIAIKRYFRDGEQLYQYGKGKGLYTITRKLLTNRNTITRLYAYGASKNLGDNYRNFQKRLLLPGNHIFGTDLYVQINSVDENPFPDVHIYGTTNANFAQLQVPTDGSLWIDYGDVISGNDLNNGYLIYTQPPKHGGFRIKAFDEIGKYVYSDGTTEGFEERIWDNKSMIEDATLIELYGVIEETKIFDEIYPERRGFVSGVVSRVSFVDAAMFDLNAANENGTIYLIAGLSAKVSFRTGNLAGYEFEVTGFDTPTKRFHIAPIIDERGLEIPNEDSPAYQISVGDEYVLLDIRLPQIYIDEAEQRLLTEATAYLDARKYPEVQYEVDVDEEFSLNLPGGDVKFRVGHGVLIADADLGVNYEGRVIGINRDMKRGQKYTLTLSAEAYITVRQRRRGYRRTGGTGQLKAGIWGDVTDVFAVPDEVFPLVHLYKEKGGKSQLITSIVRGSGRVFGGSVVWAGVGYVFVITPAIYYILNVLLTSSQQVIELEDPSDTHNRIDVIALDVNGAVVVIKGVAEEIPVKPQVNESTQLELTAINVLAASTSPNLEQLIIYNENIEWAGAFTGNLNVSFDDEGFPYIGDLACNVSHVQNNDIFLFSSPAPVYMAEHETINFNILLKRLMAAQHDLWLEFRFEGNVVGNQVRAEINKGLTGIYQQISLNLSLFNVTAIDELRFVWKNQGVQIPHPGFYIDMVVLQGGIEQPGTTGMENPMEAVGDLIVGGVSGTPLRLPRATTLGGFLLGQIRLDEPNGDLPGTHTEWLGVGSGLAIKNKLLGILYGESGQYSGIEKTVARSDHSHPASPAYEYWTLQSGKEIKESRFGGLYNHFAVRDSRNIAPEGWHVMTVADYEAIRTTLNVILNGARWSNGIFGSVFEEAWMWLHEQWGTDWGYVGYGWGNVWEPATMDVKKMGASIRLVKDDSADPGFVIGNDGERYKTIKIGGIVVTTKNVYETKYRNGDLIPIVEDNQSWGALVTGAMCYYNNDVNYAFQFTKQWTDIFNMNLLEVISDTINVSVEEVDEYFKTLRLEVEIPEQGGHVIQDDTTTFPQRTNLKFKGATVIDNGLADATEVEYKIGQEYVKYYQAAPPDVLVAKPGHVWVNIESMKEYRLTEFQIGEIDNPIYYYFWIEKTSPKIQLSGSGTNSSPKSLKIAMLC